MTKSKRLARLNELDAKRTPDPWIYTIEDDVLTLWMGSAVEERHTGCYQSSGEIVIDSDFYDEGSRSDEQKKSNAAFIAAAPDAIALCNEYAAENAKLLALLEECEGVLTYYRRVDNYMAKLADDGRFDFRNTDIHKDGGSHAREMLTKLRAAGIGGNK